VIQLAGVGCALLLAGCMRLGYELVDPDTDGSLSPDGGSGESGGSGGGDGSAGGGSSPSSGGGGLDVAGGSDPEGTGGDPLEPDGGLTFDAAPDASPPPPAFCQSYGAFSAPARLTFASTGETWGPGPSPDNTTLFVGRTTTADENVAVATRPDRGTAFGALSSVANINSNANDGTPFLTASGLSLYFYSERSGGNGQRDLMLATRADPAAPFSAPSFLTPLNSPGIDHEARLSADELSLVFESDRNGGDGGPDLWLSERTLATDSFGAPRNLSELNTFDVETGPALSADALTIMFASVRPGNAGGTDIWAATRADRASSFGAPQNVSVLNSTAYEYDVALSLDGEEVFFVSTRQGSPALWRALRTCLD